MIDIISIVPYFVTVANPNSNTKLGFIRIFRLFRMLRLNRSAADLVDLVNKTIYHSKDALYILGFYATILVIFFGALEYQFESGTFTVTPAYPNGVYLRNLGIGRGSVISQFDSIPTSIYWAIITATTVGYGDVFPVTLGGRAAAASLAVLGLMVLALPISVIGSNFNKQCEVYTEALSRNKVKKKLRKRYRQATSRKSKLLKAFKTYSGMGGSMRLDPPEQLQSVSNGGDLEIPVITSPPRPHAIHFSDFSITNGDVSSTSATVSSPSTTTIEVKEVVLENAPSKDNDNDNVKPMDLLEVTETEIGKMSKEELHLLVTKALNAYREVHGKYRDVEVFAKRICDATRVSTSTTSSKSNAINNVAPSAVSFWF